MPGSCYGSIGALDVNPDTGEPLLPQFSAIYHARYDTGLPAVARASGHRQNLHWHWRKPGRTAIAGMGNGRAGIIQLHYPIATNAQHSPWGMAFNASQRWCIENDCSWKNKYARSRKGRNENSTVYCLALLPALRNLWCHATWFYHRYRIDDRLTNR